MAIMTDKTLKTTTDNSPLRFHMLGGIRCGVEELPAVADMVEIDCVCQGTKLWIVWLLLDSGLGWSPCKTTGPVAILVMQCLLLWEYGILDSLVSWL